MDSDVEKEKAVHAVASHLKPVPRPGDRLDELFREHYDLVYRTAYRVTGRAADAEDVLQTVFLRLAQHGGAIDLSPNSAAYLRRAAVNAALDVVRARSRTRAVALEDVSLAGSGDPEALAARREVHDFIRRAVARLKPKAAELFVLKYFEGYGNDEIADAMGMSKMVVAVLLHRARSRVRKDLGEYLGRHE
jgi:RNA polymerase sigma-70 factor (ECF subfamily)